MTQTEFVPEAASTVTTDVLDAYRPLCGQASNRAFAGKLFLFVGILASGVFLTLTHALWTRILGTLVAGLMFAHGLELQHETLHNLGFRSRRANNISGILLGVPMLVSFAAYQVAHLRHHRDLGTPDNTEFFDYGDQYGHEQLSHSHRIGRWLYRLSMVAHFRQFLINTARVLGGRPIPGERPATVRRIRRDYLIILGLLSAAIVASSLTTWSAILYAWIVPLVIVAAPAHALIELPEHFCCAVDTRDVLANSRTIRSNLFMVWLTNTNNFHVEHHLLPRLPFNHLGELHVKVAARARYSERSYAAFFWRLARGRWRVTDE